MNKTLWLTIGVAVSVGLPCHGATNNETRAQPTGVATAPLTEAEQTWLRAHPQVRWGAAPDWPPFSSFDGQGNLSGIDADITRLVAERVGLGLTVVRAASWAEMLKKAEAGEVDFLSATAIMRKRLDAFDFTSAYSTFPVVVIMREEAPFFLSRAYIKTLTAAVVRDHAITLQLQQDYPELHFVPAGTVEEAIRLVARGKVDVTVQNLAVATRVIRLGGWTNLKIVGVTRYEFPLRFAVRKDAPELISILNKGLATLTRQEEEMIYSAHLTPDIGKARNWGAWRRRALYTALFGAAAVGIVAFWNRYLANEIRRRQVAEAALHEARERLERRTQELDVRVREGERLNAELRAVNQDLESFSGSVSHDLRAPLRRVIAFGGMLKEGAGQSLAGENGRWMDVIISESKRMDLLINDLLQHAQFGRAELTRQRVSLGQLVRNTIKDFEPQLKERNVVWKIGDLGEVDGDPNLLHFALANLIDNALKYSRRRAQTEIRIDVLPDPGPQGEVVFYVQDNGCGFDMTMAGKLFSPFQRLHGDYEGTGIGLANVQRIIQRHGGRIWFESEPDKGTTFYFTLPGPPTPADQRLNRPGGSVLQ